MNIWNMCVIGINRLNIEQTYQADHFSNYKNQK
jgi:hypothetical protein